MRSKDNQPEQEKNGIEWETSTLSAEGVNSGIINKLLAEIRMGSFDYIHSLLLVKNRKLILEEYFRGYNRDRTHGVASVTKSITSAVIGLLIEQGAIVGVDQSLSDLLPEYADRINADPAKRELQLWHLLTMTSGLEWDESTYPYSDPRNDCHRMKNSSDGPAFVLERPICNQPGTKFQYSCANSMLLSAIIRNLTGTNVDDFAKRYLFHPLGIIDYSWEHYSDSLTDTDGGLFLRPRDMAKIGYIFLNHGKWNGGQVISREWVEKSTKGYVDTGIIGAKYGYQWWLIRGVIHGQSVETFFASGFGGQSIFVFPSLDLIVVFTAQTENNRGTDLNPRILQNYILPALLPLAPPRATVRMQLQDLNEYVGEYRLLQTTANDLTIFQSEGRLYIQGSEEKPVELLAEKKDCLYGKAPDRSEFQISFIRDENEEVTQMTFQTGFISLHCDRIA